MHVRTYSLFILLILASVPATAQHVEIGAFGSYGNFDVPPFPGSAVGAGGRMDLNVASHLALEAEGSYDFKHPSLQIVTASVTTVDVTAFRLAIIHGNGGLKIQTKGGSYFFFLKGGILDFMPDVRTTTVTGTVIVNAGTSRSSFIKGVFYPGAGIGFYAGILGMRVDGGDEIYWTHGAAQHNLRITFGPTIRF